MAKAYKCLYCNDPEQEFYIKNHTRCKKCCIKQVMSNKKRYYGKVTPESIEHEKQLIRAERLDKMRKAG